jgi:Spy/CpxP family protein refolding chaperone
MIVAGFLGFSEAQGAKFGQLLEALQTTVGPLQQQMMAQQKTLESVLSADQPDPAAVGKLILQIRAIQKQIGQALQAYHDGFLALLTQDQKEKTQAVVGAAQLLPAVKAFAEVRLLDPPQ